jgi:hypothetical protein
MAGGIKLSPDELKQFQPATTGVRLSPAEMAEFKPEPGAGESAGRGVLQGASLGFGDEVAAGVDTLVSKIPGVRAVANAIQGENHGGALPLDNPDLTYQQRRDAYRAKNAEAQQANPVAYGAGEVGGALATSFVPGVAPARGAGLAAMAGKAALVGGANALGSSEADLTKGEFGQAAIDTGTGAAISGVTAGALGAAGKALTGGAEKRATKALVQRTLTNEGETGGTGGKILRKVNTLADGKVEAAAQRAAGVAEENVQPAPLLDLYADKANRPIFARKTGTAIAHAETRLGELGEENAQHYQQIEKAVGSVRLGDVTDQLGQKIEQLRADPSGGKEMVIKGLAAIKQEIEENVGSAGEAGGAFNPDKTISWEAMRHRVTNAQATAGAGLGQLSPSTAVKAAREASQTMKQILDEHLQVAADIDPGLSKAVDAIRANNKQIYGIATIKEALAARAEKEAGGSKNLTSILQHSAAASVGAAVGLGAHSAGLGLAIPVAAYVAPRAANAANIALAQLVRAAGNGSVTAQLIQQAIEAGVPRAGAIAAAGLANGNPTGAPAPTPIPPAPPPLQPPLGMPLAGR